MLQFAVAALLACMHPAGPEDSWALVKMKGRDIAIHPRTGEQREVPVQGQGGLLSPDGKRIVFWGTPPGGKTIDMFIADLVPPTEPGSDPVKKNVRTLLPGASGLHEFSWTADGRHILFLSGPDAGSQVYLVSTDLPPDADRAGVRPRQISDSSGPCIQPRAASDGRLAWGVLRHEKGKERLYDLLISDGRTPGQLAPDAPVQNEHPEQPRAARSGPAQRALADHNAPPGPPEPAAVRVPLDDVVAPLAATPLLKRVSLWSFEFSPDASRIAYSSGTSLYVHEFATRIDKEITFADVDKRLSSHAAHDIAWRADGTVVACFVTFLGGRHVQPGEDPYFIFGDKEIFFFPLGGEPWWVGRPPEARDLGWIAAPIE